MAEQSSGGNSGTKTGLTMIVGLFAVVAGVYSMMEPMGQRVDFISDQVKGVMTRENTAMTQERDDHALLKAMETRLLQLEKDRGHNLKIQVLNATQEEKIKALERVVYDKKSTIKETP